MKYNKTTFGSVFDREFEELKKRLVDKKHASNASSLNSDKKTNKTKAYTEHKSTGKKNSTHKKKPFKRNEFNTVNYTNLSCYDTYSKSSHNNTLKKSDEKELPSCRGPGD